jgi:general L-amino acid transport system substrate-binding protein
LVSLIVICGFAHAADTSATLARVRAAGVLHCGTDEEQAEYSTLDDQGNRTAFDADLCHAVAVAVLGKNAQVKVVSYPDDRTAMKGLSGGEVEMVATLTDDFSHAVGTHLQFTRPVLWDGVGFLVLGSSPVARARQLSGKKICFLAETTVEESVRAWFAREHLNFVPFPFQEEGEMPQATAVRWPATGHAWPRHASLWRRGWPNRLVCYRSVSRKIRWPRRCAMMIRSGRAL